MRRREDSGGLRKRRGVAPAGGLLGGLAIPDMFPVLVAILLHVFGDSLVMNLVIVSGISTLYISDTICFLQECVFSSIRV